MKELSRRLGSWDKDENKPGMSGVYMSEHPATVPKIILFDQTCDNAKSGGLRFKLTWKFLVFH